MDGAVFFSHDSIRHIILVVDVLATFGVLARVHGSSVAKQICYFLTTLAAAKPSFSKTIGCLLQEKARRDKRKRGGTSPRLTTMSEKPNNCRSKKSGSKAKASVVA
jgi:hypothetical protein